MTEVVGVDVLTNLQGYSRYARSYAFLYAAFKGKSGQSAVRDAIDCLIPFIAAYTHGIVGRQLEMQPLQRFLRTSFGFDIPIYALQQMIPALCDAGYAEFKKGPNIYVAVAKGDTFTVARAEIETDFDEIAELATRYAVGLGFNDVPPSGSWGSAIINFLKSDNAVANRAVINLRNAVLDARDVERRIVARFIQTVWNEQPARYEKIVKIFMGALVEDFLSGVSELGGIDRAVPPVIFYDTTVLLRSLGCSERLFKVATDELTRYLQDIGCDVRFLPGNESEVNNVISTIVSVKDSGRELEGETADAVSKGDISMAHIRMLQNNFVDQLARLNIFEFNDGHNALDAKLYQINEPAFGQFLHDEAMRRGRLYGHQNRANDAGYLGTVVRLRRGSRSRDFASSKYVFVTSNRLLATASRDFLIREKQLTGAQCPPILHLTQVATIAWLLKDQKLSPDIAGRELLLNCYAAARPDAEWFRLFREGIEKVVGDLDEFGRDSHNSLILQAARRVAQEQSLSNSAIMRTLNAVEILDQSRRIAESREQLLTVAHQERERELMEEHQRRQQTLMTKHADTLRDTETQARAQSADAVRAVLQNKIIIWADTRARRVVLGCQLVLLALFVGSFFADSFADFRQHPYIDTAVKVMLGSVAGLHFLDFIGLKVVSRRFDVLRAWLSGIERHRLERKFI